MSELLMPPYPNGSVQQQLTQQYSYLFQMAQQLNMALSALEGGAVSNGSGSGQQRKSGGAASAAGKAALENAEQFQNLRAMIVKTAKQVSRNMEQLETRLSEEYVASSQFGTYVQRLSAYLEANPEALTQYYSFCSDLAANVAAVDAAFSTYKLDTEGYIRTGIVYYDGPARLRRGGGTKPDHHGDRRPAGGGAEQLPGGVHRPASQLLAGQHGDRLCVQQPAVYHQHHRAGQHQHRPLAHGQRQWPGIQMDRRITPWP